MPISWIGHSWKGRRACSFVRPRDLPTNLARCSTICSSSVLIRSFHCDEISIWEELFEASVGLGLSLATEFHELLSSMTSTNKEEQLLWCNQKITWSQRHQYKSKIMMCKSQREGTDVSTYENVSMQRPSTLKSAGTTNSWSTDKWIVPMDVHLSPITNTWEWDYYQNLQWQEVHQRWTTTTLAGPSTGSRSTKLPHWIYLVFSSSSNRMTTMRCSRNCGSLDANSFIIGTQSLA